MLCVIFCVILAGRAHGRETAVANAAADHQMSPFQGWFVINREGDCVRTETPASPSDLIAADRAHGLADDIDPADFDEAGRASVVQVGEPRGNGLESMLTFYRGMAKCEEWRQRLRNELEKLE